MPQISLRFAITDDAGHRGATWKCFASVGNAMDDVYLTCRELGGAIKTSLHHSGHCHLAYEQGFFDENLTEEQKTAKGRFIDKWGMPQELVPGLTLAQRIVTPASAVTVPYSNADFPGIVWIPNAPKDKATEIDMLVSSSSFVPNEEWPGQSSMHTHLVGLLQLDSGTKVWVVHRDTAMPKQAPMTTQAAPQFFHRKSASDLAGGPLRALVFGDEPDGSRVIYDLAAEYKPKP
jgi:hypothetical protein